MNRRDVLLAAVAGVAGLLRSSRAVAGPAGVRVAGTKEMRGTGEDA